MDGLWFGRVAEGEAAGGEAQRAVGVEAEPEVGERGLAAEGAGFGGERTTRDEVEGPARPEQGAEKEQPEKRANGDGAQQPFFQARGGGRR